MSKFPTSDEKNHSSPLNHCSDDLDALEKEFMDIMQQEGLKLDPRIAEVWDGYRLYGDPYEFGCETIQEMKDTFACNPDGPVVCSGDIPDKFFEDLLSREERRNNQKLFLQGKFSHDYEDTTFERRKELLAQIRKITGFDVVVEKFKQKEKIESKIQELRSELKELDEICTAQYANHRARSNVEQGSCTKPIVVQVIDDELPFWP